MTTIIAVENVTNLNTVNNDNTLVSSNTPTILQVIDDSNILVKEVVTTNVIHSGIAGPAGATGPAGAPGGEDEVAQEKRTDFIDDETLYRGEAIPGSADAAAVWRIRKITISAIDGDVREMWADGTADYIKVWNNRLTYTYT